MREDYEKLKNGTWIKVTKQDFEPAKEKKYYFKNPFVCEGSNYLNFYKNGNFLYYGYRTGDFGYQTQFTKAEYAAIAVEKGIPEGYHIEIEVTE